MTDPAVRAVPAVDELVSDTGAVVLLREGTADRVVRLSPLGAAVRAFTSERGMPLSSLTAHLTSVFGEPGVGDPVGLTRDLVSQLVVEGVVRWEGDDPAEPGGAHAMDGVDGA